MTRRAFSLTLAGAATAAAAPSFDQRKGRLLYETTMATRADMVGWKLEGPGTTAHHGGWMEMWSPGEQMHHVYWCPEAFPASFAAEWEMQNLHPQAGLCIVFFAATGLDGQDVHDPALPARDGTFSQYNKGELKNYHISYYANTPNLPARPVARLRKNPGAVIVHEGPPGIVADSTEIHRVRLMKDRAQIALWVDDRLIIDWTDNGEKLGGAYGGGKIALRQMRWTQFRYRNFRVWGLKG